MDFKTSHLIDLIAIYLNLKFTSTLSYRKFLTVLSSYLDSAHNSMIEATQAYGIEEPSETELQVQVFVATSQLIISITKFLIEIGSPCAYLSRNQHTVM